MPRTIGYQGKLQNRHAECEELERLLADARTGASGVAVLRGEAGVGKTALLDFLRSRAAGCRVVTAAGVESEMELPFAVLHQLCAPFLDLLPRLPAPQRDALATTFGLQASPPPDRFLVGLAVLSLLAEVARRQPLVCVLDDAQWIDRASAQVFGFVARRLAAEGIVLVFALRETSEDQNLIRLPELRVGPLPESDARALLAAALPGGMDEAVRERILAEARGNPLALLELPRGWTREAFAGGFGTPDAASVPSLVEQSYVRRLAPLAPDTKLLMLVAAADQAGDPVLIWKAARRLGIPDQAVAAAREAGLLDLREVVRFRHPLVRSTVYREAGIDERRLAHQALAEVTDADTDPDRRAWHRAAAVAGPDEAVASELERSAGRAQARGGMAAAAAFLQRAVTLTGDPSARATRALAAAQASLGAGEFAMTRGLLATAGAGPLDRLGRARVQLLDAQVSAHETPGPHVPALLLAAARELEQLDVRIARGTYLTAWSTALFVGRFAAPEGNLLQVSRAALAAPRDPSGMGPSDLLLEGLALLMTEGRSTALPVLRRAIEAFAGPQVPVEEMARWGWLATRAANVAWDFERGLEIGARAARLARDMGALEVLVLADNASGQAAALAGDFSTASMLAAEFHAVREATGTRVGPLGEIALAGVRGREAEATALTERVIAEATARGHGAAAQYAHWARSVLMNGLGSYEEARAEATEAAQETPELFIAMWAQVELIEAATRSGDLDLAAEAYQRFFAQTEATDSDWALGLRARCRALLTEGEDAGPLYQEAIDRLGRTRLLPDLARAHLLYGEWLRRVGRRGEARERLQTAHAMFTEIGMVAFGARARQELAATGGRAVAGTDEGRDRLTPQEEHIARLARDGLSNSEIGAQLFLSGRTVEWHLRNVYAKLGVSSRKELRRALPPSNGRGIAV